MRIRYVTLRPWPLTLKICGTSTLCHKVKVGTKYERNRTIPDWLIDNLAIFANITSRCDLYTPWPWTFVVLPAWCVQTLYNIWLKSNNPRQTYWPFSTFSSSDFRGWAQLCAHPGVRSAPSNWGSLQKSGGTVKMCPFTFKLLPAPMFTSSTRILAAALIVIVIVIIEWQDIAISHSVSVSWHQRSSGPALTYTFQARFV